MACEFFDKMAEAIDDVVIRMTAKAKTVSPTDLHLDGRCANSLFVMDSCIIANKSDDKMLQYYGGFEYVEPEHRLAVGNFVIYSSGSDRVLQHLQHLETEH